MNFNCASQKYLSIGNYTSVISEEIQINSFISPKQRCELANTPSMISPQWQRSLTHVIIGMCAQADFTLSFYVVGQVSLVEHAWWMYLMIRYFVEYIAVFLSFVNRIRDVKIMLCCHSWAWCEIIISIDATSASITSVVSKCPQVQDHGKYWANSVVELSTSNSWSCALTL